MKLTSEEFDRIAQLSMLEFTEEEKAVLMEDLNKLLAEAEKLNDFDVSDTEPLINPVASFEFGQLREDSPTAPLPQKIVLNNAPEKQGSYIVVSKRSYLG